MEELKKASTHVHAEAGSLLLVLGIIFIAANLRGPITGVGPLIGELRQDTGLSSSMVGLLTSLPLLAFAALSSLAPSIARLKGIEATLFFSMILLTAGIVLRSVPHNSALFIGTLIIGLAIALSNVLLPSLIKRDFPRHIGSMTGAYSTSMNIFGAIASGLSVPLSIGLGLGWRGALLSWTILTLLALILWLPRLRGRHIPEPVPIAGSSIWRSPLAWQVTMFMGLQSLLFYVIAAWLPEILQAKGMSSESAGWMLSIFMFVGLPTTFLAPVIAGRRADQRAMVLIIIMLYLIGCFGLLWGTSKLALLWIISFGLASGASISLALAFFGLRSRNSQQAAQLSGMAQTIGYLLAAVGPILAGYLFDASGNWASSLIMLIIVTFLLLFAGLGAGRNVHL